MSFSRCTNVQLRYCRELLRAELGDAFDCRRLAIYSSPFTRTMQTAQLVGHNSLLQPAMLADCELRICHWNRIPAACADYAC